MNLFNTPFIAAVLTSLMTLIPASSTAQTEGEKFGNWLYTCSDGPCQGYFSLKDPASDDTAISLGLLRNGDDVTLIVTLPQMTALRPGAQLTLPGLPAVPVQFEFCNGAGCTGFVQLEPAQIETLQSEADINVLFIPYGTSTPTSYSIPITGFAGVFERLGALE